MSAGQATKKKPFLRKGGGVANKARGASGKSAGKKAEDQARLSARSAKTAELNENRSERLGTAGLKGASKGKGGGANANAPGGKNGFAPGTSVKDRIAAWEGGTGGGGSGGLKPAETKTEEKKDPVLESNDPNPTDVIKKLDEGKSDPALWERIKSWVTGLLTKKDMPPAEVKKQEAEAASGEPKAAADPEPGVPEIPTSMDDIVDGGKGLLDQGADALGGAVSQGEDMVGEQVGALEDQAGAAIGEAEGMVGDKVSELEGQAGSAISSAEGAVSGKVSEMEDAVGAQVEETEGAIAKKWKESPARSAAAKLIGAENMDKVDDAIAGGYRQLKEKAKELWSGAKGAVGDKYEEIKGAAGDLYEGAKDTVKGKYEELKGQAGDLYEGAKDQVKGAWEGAKSFASKLKFW